MCVCVSMHTTFALSIHLLMDTGCFHVSVIINNAAVSIGARISVQHSDFISFGRVPRSGIAGLYGSSVFNFFEETPYCFP